MGIYDRDYYRPPTPQAGPLSKLPQTVVGWLILVNVAIFVADLFTPADINGVGHWLSDRMAVHVSTLWRPWLWWQFLTAGFAHAPLDITIWHILNNMFALFIFGRNIEARYGSKEFLRFYLTTLIAANVAWSAIGNLTGADPDSGAYGASGAIAGIIVLYAFNFPHHTFLLFFAIPMPAWLLGVLIVALDMFGAFGGKVGNDGMNVAYSVHLAGAAFALLYYQLRWDLTSFFDKIFMRPAAWFTATARGKPRLRVHRPEPNGDQPPSPRDEPDSELAREVDRILEKIYRDGEASLTPKERQTLEDASRKYRGGRK